MHSFGRLVQMLPDLGFEALDLHIFRNSLCSSLNCWQSKFVIELEQNVDKEIFTENCLWNSI